MLVFNQDKNAIRVFKYVRLFLSSEKKTPTNVQIAKATGLHIDTVPTVLRRLVKTRQITVKKAKIGNRNIITIK